MGQQTSRTSLPTAVEAREQSNKASDEIKQKSLDRMLEGRDKCYNQCVVNINHAINKGYGSTACKELNLDHLEFLKKQGYKVSFIDDDMYSGPDYISVQW